MVDLQKGERYVLRLCLMIVLNAIGRYANADYALAMALHRGYAVKYLMTTYDIACQYGNNIEERFAKNFPDLVEIVSRIEFLVPKLHLQGHKDDCQYRYSLNFADNAGRNHGEGIETGWAARNEEGGSTKEMNHGHRHDTLDDHSGDWNWKKVQRMCKFMFL